MPQALPSIPVDILLIVIVFAALTGAVVIAGKSRSLSAVIALYLGLLLFEHFPYTQDILAGTKAPTSIYLNIGLLVAFVAAAYTTIGKTISGPDIIGLRWIEAPLLAGATTGLLLTVALGIPKFGQFYHFSAATKAFFTFEHALFWWLAGCLAVTYILLRR